MKRAIVAAAALAFASAAQAQGAGSTSSSGSGRSFGVGGGATFPTGDVSDFLSTGFNVMGLVGFEVPMIPFGLRVDAIYNHHSFKDCTGACSGSARVFGGNLNAVFSFPMEGTGFAPYITGGIGFANVDASADFTGISDSRVHGSIAAAETSGGSENKFSWNAGGGIKFGISGLEFFAEARYLSVLTNDGSTNLIPITLGITFHP
jgi:opacity protein-like surface antigen